MRIIFTNALVVKALAFLVVYVVAVYAVSIALHHRKMGGKGVWDVFFFVRVE